jgi:hypothetical protein
MGTRNIRPLRWVNHFHVNQGETTFDLFVMRLIKSSNRQKNENSTLGRGLITAGTRKNGRLSLPSGFDANVL